jgi:hypothetical protein
MSPVRYELGSYIPGDGILHISRRGTLESYPFVTRFTEPAVCTVVRALVLSPCSSLSVRLSTVRSAIQALQTHHHSKGNIMQGCSYGYLIRHFAMEAHECSEYISTFCLS